MQPTNGNQAIVDPKNGLLLLLLYIYIYIYTHIYKYIYIYIIINMLIGHPHKFDRRMD